MTSRLHRVKTRAAASKADYCLGKGDESKKEYIDLIFNSMGLSPTESKIEAHEKIVAAFKITAKELEILAHQFAQESLGMKKRKWKKIWQAAELQLLGRHIILSLPEKESLGMDEWTQAAALFFTITGYDQCSRIVFCTHSNTKNEHAHLALLMADREGRPVKIRGEKAKIKRAVREIEKKFGLNISDKDENGGVNEYFIKTRYSIKEFFRSVIDAAIEVCESFPDFLFRVRFISSRLIPSFLGLLAKDNQHATLERVGEESIEQFTVRLRQDGKGFFKGISLGFGRFATKGSRLGSEYTFFVLLKRIQSALNLRSQPSDDAATTEPFAQGRLSSYPEQANSAAKNSNSRHDPAAGLYATPLGSPQVQATVSAHSNAEEDTAISKKAAVRKEVPTATEADKLVMLSAFEITHRIPEAPDNGTKAKSEEKTLPKFEPALSWLNFKIFQAIQLFFADLLKIKLTKRESEQSTGALDQGETPALELTISVSQKAAEKNEAIPCRHNPAIVEAAVSPNIASPSEEIGFRPQNPSAVSECNREHQPLEVHAQAKKDDACFGQPHEESLEKLMDTFYYAVGQPPTRSQQTVLFFLASDNPKHLVLVARKGACKLPMAFIEAVPKLIPLSEELKKIYAKFLNDKRSQQSDPAFQWLQHYQKSFATPINDVTRELIKLMRSKNYDRMHKCVFRSVQNSDSKEHPDCKLTALFGKEMPPALKKEIEQRIPLSDYQYVTRGGNLQRTFEKAIHRNDRDLVRDILSVASN